MSYYVKGILAYFTRKRNTPRLVLTYQQALDLSLAGGHLAAVDWSQVR